MFWNFNNSSSAQIEAILKKDNVTLHDLMEEEQLLQECKSQNQKLLEFLVQPNIIEEMVCLLVTEPPPDRNLQTRFKHANLACELLSCDVPAIIEKLTYSNLLLILYKFLEKEKPLNPLLTSFVCKVFSMLLQRRTEQNWYDYQVKVFHIIDFFQSQENFVQIVSRHVGTSAVMDFVSKLICSVNEDDLQIRTKIYGWLSENKLIESLVEKLNGDCDSDDHASVDQIFEDVINAAQNSPSDTSPGYQNPIVKTLQSEGVINRLMDILLSEDRTESSVSHVVNVLLNLLSFKTSFSSSQSSVHRSDSLETLSDLAQMKRIVLTAIIKRLPELQAILKHSPNTGKLATTYGAEVERLGSTRLKIVTLISHVISTCDLQVHQEMASLRTLDLFIELFFKFSLNNFVHAQVTNGILSIIQHMPNDTQAEDRKLSSSSTELMDHSVGNQHFATDLNFSDQNMTDLSSESNFNPYERKDLNNSEQIDQNVSDQNLADPSIDQNLTGPSMDQNSTDLSVDQNSIDPNMDQNSTDLSIVNCNMTDSVVSKPSAVLNISECIDQLDPVAQDRLLASENISTKVPLVNGDDIFHDVNSEFKENSEKIGDKNVISCDTPMALIVKCKDANKHSTTDFDTLNSADQIALNPDNNSSNMLVEGALQYSYSITSFEERSNDSFPLNSTVVVESSKDFEESNLQNLYSYHPLLYQLIIDCKFLNKIVNCYKEDSSKQVVLSAHNLMAYKGYIRQIANAFVQSSKASPCSQIVRSILNSLNDSEIIAWEEFVTTSLQEDNERNKIVPLKDFSEDLESGMDFSDRCKEGNDAFANGANFFKDMDLSGENDDENMSNDLESMEKFAAMCSQKTQVFDAFMIPSMSGETEDVNQDNFSDEENHSSSDEETIVDHLDTEFDNLREREPDKMESNPADVLPAEWDVQSGSGRNSAGPKAFNPWQSAPWGNFGHHVLSPKFSKENNQNLSSRQDESSNKFDAFFEADFTSAFSNNSFKNSDDSFNNADNSFKNETNSFSNEDNSFSNKDDSFKISNDSFKKASDLFKNSDNSLENVNTSIDDNEQNNSFSDQNEFSPINSGNNSFSEDEEQRSYFEKSLEISRDSELSQSPRNCSEEGYVAESESFVSQNESFTSQSESFVSQNESFYSQSDSFLSQERSFTGQCESFTSVEDSFEGDISADKIVSPNSSSFATPQKEKTVKNIVFLPENQNFMQHNEESSPLKQEITAQSVSNIQFSVKHMDQTQSSLSGDLFQDKNVSISSPSTKSTDLTLEDSRSITSESHDSDTPESQTQNKLSLNNNDLDSSKENFIQHSKKNVNSSNCSKENLHDCSPNKPLGKKTKDFVTPDKKSKNFSTPDKKTKEFSISDKKSKEFLTPDKKNKLGVIQKSEASNSSPSPSKQKKNKKHNKNNSTVSEVPEKCNSDKQSKSPKQKTPHIHT